MTLVQGLVESQPPPHPELDRLASANGLIVIFPLDPPNSSASGRQVLFTAHSEVPFPTFIGSDIACNSTDPTGTHGCYGLVGGGKFELKIHHAHGFDTFSGSIEGGPSEPTPFNGSGSFNLT